MKDLIRQLVKLAKAHSKDARLALAEDRAKPMETMNFYCFLRYRAMRSSYMHSARLVKREQQKRAEAMALGRRLARESKQWRKAA